MAVTGMMLQVQILTLRYDIMKEHDLTLATVPANLTDLLWDKIEPFIEMVASKASDDIVTSVIKEQCRLGNQMPLVIYRGSDIVSVSIMTVRTLDSGIKALYIPIVSGSEIDTWDEDYMALLTKIAKAYGCTELRGMSIRKGWMTKLKPFGWEEMFTTVRCKLGE